MMTQSSNEMKFMKNFPVFRPKHRMEGNIRDEPSLGQRHFPCHPLDFLSIKRKSSKDATPSDKILAEALAMELEEPEEISTSHARQFLDLTAEALPMKNRRKRALFKKRDSSVESIDTKHSLETICLVDKEGFEDDENTNYDSDLEDHVMDAWSNADAAFIQEVHRRQVALEKELEEKEIESPYRQATDIFPSFQNIHKELKGELLGQKKNDQMQEEGSSFKRRHSQILRRESKQLLLQRSFYNERFDGISCLPLVLVEGLERPIPDYEMKVVHEILTELYSPLKCWRIDDMDMIEKYETE
mmetsp:Transcript_1354/g.1792  ORF Transcript_1354/g.1792 Transcript_1354/m.1792 type:complete len:301 (+) Transcript_1354:90-992(+)